MGMLLGLEDLSNKMDGVDRLGFCFPGAQEVTSKLHNIMRDIDKVNVQSFPQCGRVSNERTQV